MTNVIGITGRMGSGKTTLINKIKNYDENFEYLNVDDFRRADPKLSNLLKDIYINPLFMKKYKDILYSNLKNYLNNSPVTTIVEWALIIEDNLMDLFEKIIIVDCNEKEILERLKNGDLGIKRIKERLNLQMTTKEKLKYLENKNYIVINNNYDVLDLINYVKGG